MGRKKKYYNEEDKRDAHLKQMMDYYWNNKKILNKKNLDRYYKNKK